MLIFLTKSDWHGCHPANKINGPNNIEDYIRKKYWNANKFLMLPNDIHY